MNNPLDEILDRVRRIETRITRLALALGTNPKKEKLVETNHDVDYAVNVASTDVPISVIQEFALEHGRYDALDEVEVFCGDDKIGVVRAARQQ